MMTHGERDTVVCLNKSYQSMTAHVQLIMQASVLTPVDCYVHPIRALENTSITKQNKAQKTQKFQITWLNDTGQLCICALAMKNALPFICNDPQFTNQPFTVQGSKCYPNFYAQPSFSTT
jgi:hypothetical protein